MDNTQKMQKKIIIITLTVITLALVAAKLFLPAYMTSHRESDELTLRQNPYVMRTVLNQYTLDLHKRPHSLDDIVNAGYIKHLPLDPTTGRQEIWVVWCSSDPASPGIESISAGDPSTIVKATTQCD